MSHNRFFLSDTHFGHANCLNFKRADGCTPLRHFSCVEEMDEYMVEQWNKVVRDIDTVYHQGDVAINRKSLPILKRLKGKKRLIRGNHDIFPTAEYLEYFDEILACRVFNDTPKKFICTHIPIHPDSLSRWSANVHGHTHSNNVMLSPHHIDKRYVCVSVEQTDYAPMPLDILLEKII